MGKNLPQQLHAAYAWTAVSKELDKLVGLSGEALDRYCVESEAHAHERGVTEVRADDLRALAEWLRAHEDYT